MSGSVFAIWYWTLTIPRHWWWPVVPHRPALKRPVGVRFEYYPLTQMITWVVFCHVSRGIDIMRIVRGALEDTSMLLRCYYAFILPIFQYSSPVYEYIYSSQFWLLECQVRAVARLCTYQSRMPLNHHCCISGLCNVHVVQYKVHSNPKRCRYCELPCLLKSKTYTS